MEHTPSNKMPARSVPWWRWTVVGVGLMAIAALLWTFVLTVEEHMGKSREVSRHTQWHVNAPVEGAQAAVLLQGGEP